MRKVSESKVVNTVYTYDLFLANPDKFLILPLEEGNDAPPIVAETLTEALTHFYPHDVIRNYKEMRDTFYYIYSEKRRLAYAAMGLPEPSYPDYLLVYWSGAADEATHYKMWEVARKRGVK